MEKKSNKLAGLGSIFILLAGILWGAMGIFVRHMNELGLASMEVVAVRLILTAGIMALVLAVFRRNLFKVRLRDLWIFVVNGLASVVLFTFCYFTTLSITSLSVAAVLLYTSPIMVIFMSALVFREKITSRKVLACAVAFGGCVLVTGVLENGGSISPQVVGFGLGAAFGYALYSIMGRFAINRGYNSLTVMFYTFAFAAVGCIPLANWNTIAAFVTGGGENIPFAILMAFMTSLLPYTLYTFGLQYVEPGKASVMASVEPVVASLVGFFVFRETLSPLAMIGIALVFGAVILLNVKAGGDKT